MYEICELKSPYWFNNEEVARIQELNLSYMTEMDMAEMVEVCFRKPTDDESSKSMNTGQLLDVIRKEYPLVKATHSTKIHIGLAMKELGYGYIHRGNMKYFKVVPLKAA